MQQRRVRLGDILDDYCPRERRITNHAVVAMIDEEVKQTRCTTCQSEHEYKNAKVPPARRRKAGALTGEEMEGVIRPRPAVPPDEEPEITDETLPVEESSEPFQEVEAPSESDASAEPVPAEEGDVDREHDEWPVHRPLIRATLPRPEGQPPERKEPDFTLRGGGRFDTHRNGKRHRGHRGPRHGQGHGQGHGTRQASGQRPRHGSESGGQHGPRHGNRPGQGGGRPGQGRGQRQGPGPGRKRGR